MTRRSRLAFAAVVLVVTAVFVRLGLWQVDRLDERRATNRRARANLARPALELGGAGPAALSLPPDSLDRRRVVLRGRFAYGREVVLAPRSFGGTPGVYLLTPLVVDDSTAVPVLRGSMPAPDGFHAALAKARPAWARGAAARTEAAGSGRSRTSGVDVGSPAPARDGTTSQPGRTTARAAGTGPPEREFAGPPGPEVTVRGVAFRPPEVEPVETPDTLHAAGAVHPVLPRLDLRRVEALLPRRATAFYVRADSTTERIPAADGIRVPVPVPPPPLDDGSHLMYAVQWFTFAGIALVGGGLFLALRGRGEDAAA